MRSLRPADLFGDLGRLARDLVEDRAAAWRKVDLAAGILRGRALLHRARLGRRVYVGGRIEVVADGDVEVGDGTCLFGGMIPTEIVCHPGATLSIGSRAEINYGVSIEARDRVRIGDRCKIGSMVRIADASGGAAGPVVVGDDVWIAHGAILEPGVTIGDGSVVSAGSVVTTSIPPRSLAVGNPARPVPLGMLGSASR